MTNTVHRGSSIEFRKVRKTYGSFVALEEFSMTVAPGEFMTLLGPSGSGKTTALNCLAGFIDIGEGDILIDGVSIARVPTEKRGIGMVFQNYSLFPHRTVMGNVAFPLEMRGMGKAEIRTRSLKALEMVRLDGLADRMPHELSGGQKQRVAFARAVVFEPRVLLMDEPLGALDLKLRETLQLEIKQYQRQIGCTVIYVTHDQGEALTLSDRLAVMEKGFIRQLGTPQDLYDRPSSRFVAEFIGSNNIFKVLGSQGASVSMEGIGPIEITGRALPSAGYVALRPEHMRRTPQGRVVTRLEQAVFFGNSIRYVLTGADGKEISLIEPRTQGTQMPEPGSEVRFDFDDESLIYLPE
ncbi:ABC transporter ATP-binding protein [Mesorhizobium sp. CAU 1732]|uniref:ABC transporter ATP-binding protein n=1 Tax=Mesorhizobium sp. CAU 1732 TaxID=3140358 RepID=UPI003260DFB3